MVILFSTGCPKCRVLEQKLNQKNIDFTLNDDIDKIIEKGFMTAPVLKVDDYYLEFGQAIKWVNQL
jgi:glutaredoxin